MFTEVINQEAYFHISLHIIRHIFKTGGFLLRWPHFSDHEALCIFSQCYKLVQTAEAQQRYWLL